jgi:hypothetical protein
MRFRFAVGSIYVHRWNHHEYNHVHDVSILDLLFQSCRTLANILTAGLNVSASVSCGPNIWASEPALNVGERCNLSGEALG